MGKTKLYSLRDHEKFCSLIFRGASVEKAADEIGFHWNTVYRHMRQDPDLRTAYDEALRVKEEYRADRIRDKIETRALNDDDPKSADLLKKAADLWLKEARRGLDAKIEFAPVDLPELEGGRRPVSIADVAQLASELGIRIAFGVDGGDPRRALSAASDVLPDPPDA